jgi:Zn-dependent protease with chaperone function
VTATNVLGVILECAAISAVLSAVVAVLALAFISLGTGRSASTRADIAFVAAIAPAVVVVTALFAALAPSAFAAFGVAAADHCPQHLHHPHLCILHFGGLRPAAALLGAASLAAFLVRALLLGARHARTLKNVSLLESLGQTSNTGAGPFPLVLVPGSARVCHAVGAVQRRVLVSAELIEHLSPRSWSAVCAHEVEHLRRRDPLAGLIVEVALLFVPPFLSAALGSAFRGSAEAACDAAAARALGDDGVAVAEGLLEAARVFGPAAPHTPDQALGAAATEVSLEERVRELLDNKPSKAQRHLGFAAAALLTVGLSAIAVSQDAAVHHALETLLFYLS